MKLSKYYKARLTGGAALFCSALILSGAAVNEADAQEQN